MNYKSIAVNIGILPFIVVFIFLILSGFDVFYSILGIPGFILWSIFASYVVYGYINDMTEKEQ